MAESATTYYSSGLIHSVTDGRNIDTFYAYNDLGRIIEVVEAHGTVDARSTVTTYNIDGSVETVTPPRLGAQNFYYDPENRTTWTRSDIFIDAADPSNNKYRTSSTTLDAAGRLAATRDHLSGGVTEYVYDRQDRVAKQIERDVVRHTDESEQDTKHVDLITSFMYDAVGNVIKVDHPGNALDPDPSKRGLASTLTAYDALNRPTRTEVLLKPKERSDDIKPEVKSGQVIEYRYSPAGDVTNVTEHRYSAVGGTDYRKIQTSHVYDEFGRLKETHDSGGDNRTSTDITYDRLGLTTISTDRNGVASEYHNDAVGQARKQVNPDESVVTTDYDLNGNVVDTVLDFDSATGNNDPTKANFRRTTHKYDPYNRLTLTASSAVATGISDDDLVVETRYTDSGVAHGAAEVFVTNQVRRGDLLQQRQEPPVFWTALGRPVRTEHPDPSASQPQLVTTIDMNMTLIVGCQQFIPSSMMCCTSNRTRPKITIDEQLISSINWARHLKLTTQF